MKKFFAEVREWINEWFVWLTSDAVLEAINKEDMTYEEVVQIAKEEMSK